MNRKHLPLGNTGYGYGVRYRSPFIVLFYGGTSCRLNYSTVSNVKTSNELTNIIINLFSDTFAKDQRKGLNIEMESFRRLGLQRKIIGFFCPVTKKVYSLHNIVNNFSIVYPEISPNFKNFPTRYSSNFYHLITVS